MANYNSGNTGAVIDAQIDKMESITATSTELNIMDGSATTQATVTLAGTDGIVISDGDVMKQALVSDFEVYMEANLDTMGSQFTSASALATVGTIGTGVWEATDVEVAHGGTGASTFTDGGILLGSGTSAITATAVLGDGEILIGDGTTDPVALDIGSSTAVTIVGALASGSIASGFGVIDNGTSGIRTNTFTAETSIIPDASGGADIGSTSAEWGDVFIADDKKIKFGNDQDFTIEYDEDGSDIAQFAGADIGMNGKYLLNEQGRSDHVANTMSSPYYRFDGISDFIEIADDAKLDFTTQITTCAWFRAFDDDLASHAVLVGKWKESGNNREWQMNVSSTEKLVFITGDISDGTYQGERVQDTAMTNVSKWHHYVATYNAGTVVLYVNGVAVDSSEVASTHSTSLYNGSGDIQIGAYDDDSDEANGEISGVQIWNTALTATEVKELYSGASVPFKYKGASQTNIFTSNNDFESDTSTPPANWTSGGGNQTLSAVADGSAPSGSNVGVLVATGAGSSSGSNRIYAVDGLTIGLSYRITFYAKSISGNTVLHTNNTDNTTVGTTITTSWVKYSVDFISGGSTRFAYLYLEGAGTCRVDNFSVVQIGAVAEYDGSGIASDKWFDKSGNDLHGTVSGATVENAPSGDDGLVYEEGSITNPLVSAGGTISDYTGMDNYSRYVRIGNLVSVHYGIDTGSVNVATAEGSSGSGALTLNMPYASTNTEIIRGATHFYKTSGYVAGSYNYNGSGSNLVTLYEDDVQGTALSSSTTQRRIMHFEFSYRI